MNLLRIAYYGPHRAPPSASGAESRLCHWHSSVVCLDGCLWDAPELSRSFYGARTNPVVSERARATAAHGRWRGTEDLRTAVTCPLATLVSQTGPRPTYGARSRTGAHEPITINRANKVCSSSPPLSSSPRIPTFLLLLSPGLHSSLYSHPLPSASFTTN
ncbi:hypothetical protein DENSPDRAFT_399679 [Dentipellis sp. KUC8613]|nr:hypothetical protein DENSPDRAFT_399679 [Dentipellis sp. KUC8613]